MITGAELVHIKAGGGAGAKGGHHFGFGKIGRLRHLESAFVSRRDCHTQPGGQRNRHFVGRAGCCGTVRGEDGGGAEGLRRLHAPESVAIHAAGETALFAATQTVDLGQGGAGPVHVIISKGRHQRVDHRIGHEGAGGVMHQHDVRRIGGQ